MCNLICQAPRPNRADDNNNIAFVAISSMVCRLFLYTGVQTQKALRHNREGVFPPSLATFYSHTW